MTDQTTTPKWAEMFNAACKNILSRRAKIIEAIVLPNLETLKEKLEERGIEAMVEHNKAESSAILTVFAGPDSQITYTVTPASNSVALDTIATLFLDNIMSGARCRERQLPIPNAPPEAILEDFADALLELTV